MDLQSLLSHHGVPFRTGGDHRHVREGWLGVDCPWCDGVGAGKFHLGIHLGTHATNCWRCGPKRLGDVLARLLQIPLHEVMTLLGDVPRTPRIVSEALMQGGVLEHPRGLGPLLRPHLGYLRGRGFDPASLIRLWGLKGLGLASLLGWRIWIPILLDGEEVSWTTRAIGDRGTRYVNAEPNREKLPIKSLLYGWDYVRDAVIICEGPTDVWRIGPGAVAVMGLNVTSEQIDLLRNVPRRFVCFDNEPAAQKKAGELCRELSSFPGTTANVRTESIDPGEAGEEEVTELRGLLE